MIDQAEAARRAREAIGAEFVLLDEHTREESFGWIFFYDSAVHVMSGADSDLVAGNAPIVVLRDSGEVRPTGTGRPVEVYLVAIRDEWEKRQR